MTPRFKNAKAKLLIKIKMASSPIEKARKFFGKQWYVFPNDLTIFAIDHLRKILQERKSTLFEKSLFSALETGYTPLVPACTFLYFIHSRS